MLTPHSLRMHTSGTPNALPFIPPPLTPSTPHPHSLDSSPFTHTFTPPPLCSQEWGTFGVFDLGAFCNATCYFILDFDELKPQPPYADADAAFELLLQTDADGDGLPDLLDTPPPRPPAAPQSSFSVRETPSGRAYGALPNARIPLKNPLKIPLKVPLKIPFKAPCKIPGKVSVRYSRDSVEIPLRFR